MEDIGIGTVLLIIGGIVVVVLLALAGMAMRNNQPQPQPQRGGPGSYIADYGRGTIYGPGISTFGDPRKWKADGIVRDADGWLCSSWSAEGGENANQQPPQQQNNNNVGGGNNNANANNQNPPVNQGNNGGPIVPPNNA